MTAAIGTLALVAFICIPLWLMVRNEKPTLIAHDVPAEHAHPLFDALVEYIESGGDITQVIGYGANAHPSGNWHIYLVTQGDVVAGAERILAGGEVA